MFEQYKDRAAFFIVYIQEAHASDVWQMESNIKQHVVFANPKTYEERTDVAGACVRNLHLSIPAVLDGLDNRTDIAYTGWPDRLYVIDRSGHVAYKSKAGPFGFHPKEMEDSLKRVLSDGHGAEAAVHSDDRAGYKR